MDCMLWHISSFHRVFISTIKSSYNIINGRVPHIPISSSCFERGYIRLYCDGNNLRSTSNDGILVVKHVYMRKWVLAHVASN